MRRLSVSSEGLLMSQVVSHEAIISRVQRTCLNLHERKWYRVFITIKRVELLLLIAKFQRTQKKRC